MRRYRGFLLRCVAVRVAKGFCALCQVQKLCRQWYLKAHCFLGSWRSVLCAYLEVPAYEWQCEAQGSSDP